jgi:hypothetical protein
MLQGKSGIFSCKNDRYKMPQTIDKSTSSRIYGHGRGWVFSPRDFADLAGRSTIDSELHRLANKGTIRRVIRGIYDYPRFSDLLDQKLSPDIDLVAQALARKFGWRIQPGGAVAQNLLGLSTQVPARAVYLSDGPDRTYRIGKTTLVFEHTALKETVFKLRESGLIVQALKSLGPNRITPDVISTIRQWLPRNLRTKVLADTRTATGWVHAAIQRIVKEKSDG